MKLKLVKKLDEARGTKSFFWEPERPVNYLPGQYFYYTIPVLKYPDQRGTTRHFTISSSPTEGNLLRLTTRIRDESGFKKTLDELAAGSEIEGAGPNGTFILDEQEPGPHVFIAGGIGITPFRVFIKYNADKNLEIPMYLIYSNSSNDFAFKKEFDQLQKEHDYIKIQYFDSSVSGHLDASFIRYQFKIWSLSFDIPTFWLVGSPPFIDATEEILEKMKIPSDHVRSEKFTGY